MKGSAPFSIFGGVLLGITVGHAGQVVLDGSLGLGGPVSGPNYSIPDTVGRTVGNNLFHSFSRLDLDAGDVATFTGPANIHNVISRVTGGSASAIDGTIQCTIEGANFFLINPFGVVFGPNARVDVSGSFAVTTADYVKLADGGRFDARNRANDLLTTAPVTAFGFSGPTAAPIMLRGPSADVSTPVVGDLAEGKTLLVVGGDVHVNNEQFNVPSGRVALIGVGSAGEVSFDVDDVRSSIDTSAFSHLGKVELTTFATFDVSGDPGGRIDIQAQDLTIRDSFLGASSFGVQDGLGIDLTAHDSIALRGGTVIFTEALDTGAAGNLSMTANSILFEGEPVTGTGAVNLYTDTFGPGRAGDISIRAGTFTMRNGVTVAADTAGDGDAGNIDIVAKSVVMEGQESTAVLSSTSYDGKPGSITIQTDALLLKADAQISAATFGANPAGMVQITAKTVAIDGEGTAPGGFTGISVDSGVYDLSSGLRAGDVVINAETFSLRNGARVSSTSATDQPGGDIEINALRKIELVGGEIATQAGGDGGNVRLTTPSLVYLLHSRITAESASGNGGNITIDPQFVILDRSALIASAVQGNGGNVDISSKFFLRSGSTIDVSSEFGLEGAVTITAPDVDLTGSLEVLTADLLEAETLLIPHCSVRLPGGVSSFMLLDRGGVPVNPGMLLPATQNADRDGAR